MTTTAAPSWQTTWTDYAPLPGSTNSYVGVWTAKKGTAKLTEQAVTQAQHLGTAVADTAKRDALNRLHAVMAKS